MHSIIVRCVVEVEVDRVGCGVGVGVGCGVVGLADGISFAFFFFPLVCPVSDLYALNSFVCALEYQFTSSSMLVFSDDV